MSRAAKTNNYQCIHKTLTVSSGLLLVTFEDPVAENKGFASALCDSLPPKMMEGVCRANLASPAGLLAGYLGSHKVVILIDPSKSCTATNTVSMFDLTTMLERSAPLNIGSDHGFVIAEELREAQRLKRLPERIIVFCFAGDVPVRAKRQADCSQVLWLTSVKNASLLLGTVIETLKKQSSPVIPADDANKVLPLLG